jgi:hypothetical protein
LNDPPMGVELALYDTLLCVRPGKVVHKRIATAMENDLAKNKQLVEVGADMDQI